ncbi:hypothetical protein DM01DRAFT_347493 [Hesseltinella vesiculosa]|uniref:Uncharacterized protein n=1 Tax=Hesseltinella vesiculosa TaxID=101127 RepID=A0A1X2GFN7_9FUNG|nr:hypothetical protein DM01DRAFT_347493 [Hesseltinella vesiculosa]
MPHLYNFKEDPLQYQIVKAIQLRLIDRAKGLIADFKEASSGNEEKLKLADTFESHLQVPEKLPSDWKWDSIPKASDRKRKPHLWTAVDRWQSAADHFAREQRQWRQMIAPGCDKVFPDIPDFALTALPIITMIKVELDVMVRDDKTDQAASQSSADDKDISTMWANSIDSPHQWPVASPMLIAPSPFLDEDDTILHPQATPDLLRPLSATRTPQPDSSHSASPLDDGLEAVSVTPKPAGKRSLLKRAISVPSRAKAKAAASVLSAEASNSSRETPAAEPPKADIPEIEEYRSTGAVDIHAAAKPPSLEMVISTPPTTADIKPHAHISLLKPSKSIKRIFSFRKNKKRMSTASLRSNASIASADPSLGSVPGTQSPLSADPSISTSKQAPAR